MLLELAGVGQVGDGAAGGGVFIQTLSHITNAGVESPGASDSSKSKKVYSAEGVRLAAVFHNFAHAGAFYDLG